MVARLLYLCAPSGAGKDALLTALKPFPNAPYAAVRTITRPADVTEASEPVTEMEFWQLKKRGVFVFDWSANGFLYGIRATELTKAATVIINGSRAYWPTAKGLFPNMQLITIEVPDAVLKERLEARGRESEFEIYARLRRNRQLAESLRLEAPGITLINDRTPHDMAVDLMEYLGC